MGRCSPILPMRCSISFRVYTCIFLAPFLSLPLCAYRNVCARSLPLAGGRLSLAKSQIGGIPIWRKCSPGNESGEFSAWRESAPINAAAIYCAFVLFAAAARGQVRALLLSSASRVFHACISTIRNLPRRAVFQQYSRERYLRRSVPDEYCTL